MAKFWFVGAERSPHFCHIEITKSHQNTFSFFLSPIQSIIIAMSNAATILHLPATDAQEQVQSSVRSMAFKPFETPTSKPKNKGQKIALPTMEGLCFEKVKHVAYLEASGNYTVLHFTDKRQTLVCKTLREVEMLLPEDAFVRIHRSHTIHLRHIKKYVRGKGGHVLLQNGVTLTVSAGQKEVFMERIRCYFGAA
jgi:DNA-binding LytR/AlgR family response regulator